jgi:hypothetical protein
MFFAVKKKIFFFRTIFMARLGNIAKNTLVSALPPCEAGAGYEFKNRMQSTSALNYTFCVLFIV